MRREHGSHALDMGVVSAGARPIERRLEDAGLPALPRRAWLEIDLDALVANAHAARSLLTPSVRLAAVVKADGYGHGIEMAARAFVAGGAGLLCVATFDEALSLRTAGVTAPVLVLFRVPPDCLAEAAAQRVEVVASSEDVVDELLAVAGRRTTPDEGVPSPDRSPGQRAGAAGDTNPLRVHVEVETGLGRAGLAPDRAARAVARLGAQRGIQVVGLWSHLASADDPAVSAAQLARFQEAERAVRAAGLDVPPRHLAATGGLLGDTAPAFEQVRLGLCLYGLLPEAFPVAERARSVAASLRPALSLKARALRLEHVEPGRGVGYGGRWRAERPSLVATLPVGYGDGWSFVSAGRTRALVRGRSVPLIGSVAMDAVAADVTEVPGVTPADEYVLLGSQDGASIGALDLARVRTTIPWEVVAGMARRLPRVYDSAPGLLGIRTLAGEVTRREALEQWVRSVSGTATSAISK